MKRTATALLLNLSQTIICRETRRGLWRLSSSSHGIIFNAQQTATRAYTVNNRRKDSALDVLNNIKSILLDPSAARMGVLRTLQIAASLNRVSLEVIAHRNLFTGKDGSLSVPKVMRKLFEEFGATYIKLGQFIASSPTLFPAEYVKEFQSCLDKTPPIPYDAIRKTIEADLGRPISSTFASFDVVPLATASIAQVHRARLFDGTEVVVKVRKPGVEDTLTADLSFLLIASKLLETINPHLSSLSLANIVTDIRDSMMDELDFYKEIANLENFQTFLVANHITDAVAPRPYRAYSGRRVLTMEYLEGAPLVDLESLRLFTDKPEEALVTALRTWALSVSLHDTFHADLHAGNLLVLKDGRVGFIDFGIVGKISPSFRAAMEDLHQALLKEDYRGVARALVGIGATQGRVDMDQFGADLQALVRRVSAIQPEIHVTSNQYGQTTEARIKVDEAAATQLVLDTVAVAERNGLRLPREFGLLLKQVLYFDRYQKLLAPSLDPLRDIRMQGSITSRSRNKAESLVINVK